MKKLRVTHAAYKPYTDQVVIRFSGDSDPFWAMRDRLVDLGIDNARWDPRYDWKNGREGGWWIDQDVLPDLQEYFSNLEDMLAKAKAAFQKEEQDLPDWDDMPYEEDERREQEHRHKEEQTRVQTPMPRTLQEAFSALELPMSAGRDEVKRAYRKLALVHHPDKHTQEPETIRVQHEALFKRINSANMIIIKWLETCRR